MNITDLKKEADESVEETIDLSVAGDVNPPEWVIIPRRAGWEARVREVWRYRRLTKFFGSRALQKLYRRTKLGRAWLFIRPLFPLAVKTVIFGGLLGVGSEGVPYFLFLVAGTTPWELFASALLWGTRSLELNRGIIKQIYVPRLILPISQMTPAFLTFFIYMTVLTLAVVVFGIRDGRNYIVFGVGLVWSALAVVLTVIFAMGLAFWTSVPAMVARDVRFTLGFVLGFWIFLTPILYPLSAVPEQWRMWVMLNPMAALVETFKWGLLGIGSLDLVALAVAVVLIALTNVTGLMFFVRTEAEAADKT